MAAGAPVGAPAITDPGAAVAAYAVILIFGALGGILFAMIQGVKFCGYEIPPVCTAVTVPPLVGMVIFGCLARNFFGELTEVHYPEVWADTGRQICLSIILMRGGLELDFEGKGLTVVLLTFIPQVFEAVTVAVFTHVFFGYPWS